MDLFGIVWRSGVLLYLTEPRHMTSMFGATRVVSISAPMIHASPIGIVIILATNSKPRKMPHRSHVSAEIKYARQVFHSMISKLLPCTHIQLAIQMLGHSDPFRSLPGLHQRSRTDDF
jgi:hypothetical protein